MWDERYDTKDYVYGKEPNGFLASMLPQLAGQRILSLAEGEGRNAVFLAEQGYDVLAVDASAVGLDKARALAEERAVSIEIRVADLGTFDIEEGTWDAIVSIFCHVPVEIRKALHRKVVQGLRPGGVLVLEAYTPRQLDFKTGGPPVAELMMDLGSLSEELAGLDFVHAIETERDIVEGLYHTGRGAVVQVLARKPAE